VSIFPDVPDVPGVPPLLRNPLSPSVLPKLITGDVVGLISGLFKPQWGVYKGDQAVVVADTVTSMEYKQDWTISDYPVENGGFASYDKVALPFDARVRFAMGGSVSDREAMLESIEDIAGSLELFDIVTPERVYSNVNVTHYAYSRSATNGVGLLQVDIFLVEVRETGTAELSNTQDPSGAGTVNDGTVQTTPATPAQQQSVASELLGG
jgi:hypothetical protein